MKKYVKISCSGKELCKKCELADGVFSRFMGLMFRKSLPEHCGLLLVPCNEVHTFNMNFAIDVVTLNKENEIIAVFDSVPRGKVKPRVKGGAKVLELNAGVMKSLGIDCGEKCEITAIN